MSQATRIAVVGATGAVGATMLEVLAERGFSHAQIVPFASERSAGAQIDHEGERLVVQTLEEKSIDGFDVALFSAGSTMSLEWAPKFVEKGAVVVDNSSAWRMDPDTPLVVPEVNPDDVANHKGVIANPNCSTIQMVVALAPIHRSVGIERLVITTFQATSGTGKKATRELFFQSRAVLENREFETKVYPHQIAFNVLPQADTFAEDDSYTTEERKLVDETHKILHDNAIGITATCTRVPVYNSHSEAVNVQTREPLSAEACRDLLTGAAGVIVEDDPAAALYPLAINATGRDEVFVGRIREDESAERCLNLWIVADNLRKGAATNAIQIVELLEQKNLI